MFLGVWTTIGPHATICCLATLYSVIFGEGRVFVCIDRLVSHLISLFFLPPISLDFSPSHTTVNMKSLSLALLVAGATAFPFVPDVPGVESPWRGLSGLRRRQQNPEGAGSLKLCPKNKHHVPAAPFNPKYPYNYAQNGQAGKGVGGYLVPAKVCI